MATSPTLSEKGRADPAASIYEGQQIRASAFGSAIVRAATGLVLGAACWDIIARLGAPNIFGIGTFSGLIPSAIAGAALGLTRWRRAPLWLSAGLVAILVIVAYTGLAGPSRRLIRADPVPRTADAVVVLSAGVTGDGFVPQQGTDRLRKAVELVRSGVATNLVVTREVKRIAGKVVTSSADQGRLIAMAGVTKVYSAGLARSTRDEALGVAALARARGWRRMVVVTSPYHSRRACAAFEKVGLIVACVPADSRDIAIRTLSSPEDRVDAFAMWIYELAGTLRYRLSGWM